MNNNQRLIPFLGGLVLGGVGTSVIDNNRLPYYNNYYPSYYYPYQYPAYNYYQTNTFQQLPTNSSTYPMYNQQNYIYPNAKIIEENPSEILINNNERSLKEISYVRPYRWYK